MIEINGKIYRNLQEQVGENQEDIEALDERVTTLENTTVDAYTKAESDAKFQTIAGMSSYYTKTASDDKFQPISSMSTYATKAEAVTKDALNNVDEVLQVEHLQSETYEEDDDCKADIYLYSGLRRSRVIISSDGEETGSSITLQGTTSVGSEGTVEIAGETNFTTDNRITVTDSNSDVEQIAYLSDINATLGDIETLLAAI